MVQFESYLRRVLCKTLLIFPRIYGPNMSVLYINSQRKGLQVVATLFNNTCNLEVIGCHKNFKNVFIVDLKISTVDGIQDDLQRSW